MIAMTAVLPAVGGCNLKCAGCFINQRKETNTIDMRTEDYLRFFKETLAMPEVNSFSIQGHEALLPSVYELTKELLHMSWDAGLVTLLVTNGVYLKEVAHEIVQITDSIIVSVDSHNPALHDLSRGEQGAWQKTIGGIQAVRDCFEDGVVGDEVFSKYISVASILYPGKVDRLLGMPELLKKLGVTNWVISPLISLKRGGYHDSDYIRVRENLLQLTEMGKTHGVRVALSDEFRKLEHVEDLFKALSVDTLDKNATIVRLSPDASVRVGREILQEESFRKWDRREDPVEFLKGALAEYKIRYSNV
jgi:MoaA/NifB/PqqE/SkfB family radical SAM enzyme